MPAVSGLSVAEVGGRLDRTCREDTDVEQLRYVFGQRRDALARMGVHTVRDLFLHVPHRYLDFSHVTDIAHADVGSDATIIATVDEVTTKYPRPRLHVTEISVLDQTGVLQVSLFQRPWIVEQLKPGDVLALSGKISFAFGFKQMRSPFMEKLDGSEDPSTFARILPVHPAGEGASPAWMRRIVAAALADGGDVADFLPARIVGTHKLMTLGRALREVHFPRSFKTKETARRRLAFDELICLQLALRTRQSIEQRGITPTTHVISGPRMRALLAALPFSLSPEQRQAANEVLADMASRRVMNRLLLGDVGCGKTAVAAVALAAVCDTRSQAAMMAPTSVLAHQYAERLGPLLDAAQVSWALLTGSTSQTERVRAREGVAKGEICVIFGTTALLSGSLEFRHLSLIVIDEQHRFGVDQRASLRRKGAGADLLAMTATPIPRTLALSFYGDLDCSRITRRPKPGAGIETSCISPENLDLAWGAIREASEMGRQAYVICPLVDDADDGSDLDDVPDQSLSAAKQLHSATSTARELSHTLRGLSIGLLHGRLSSADKDAVMDDFRQGKLDVLVSTTVVEVGVDVPNATVMLVLDADRFGLATLHQLRGRVGRGDVKGTAFLCCAAKKGTPARRRLSALEETSDGLALAERDLSLRHEGELLGYRQSGGITLKIADLAADGDLVRLAHADAREISAQDPRLSEDDHIPLALEVKGRFGGYFDELERA